MLCNVPKWSDDSISSTKTCHWLFQVRALEQANRVLEAQVEQLSNEVPSRMGDMYEEELARWADNLNFKNKVQSKFSWHVLFASNYVFDTRVPEKD